MKTTAKVTGWKDLQVNVSELEKKLARGATRTALTKASRIVTAAAKRKAPIGRTGLLKKSIRQKIITKVKTSMVSAIIGASTKVAGKDPKTGEVVRPANYSHLVEFGTAARGVFGRKGVSITPGNPPQPFLRPAMEENRAAVLAKYKAEMGPAIAATARKIHKQRTRSTRLR